MGSFYYAKGDSVPGIWRVSTRGGEETEIVSSMEAGYWGYWALVDDATTSTSDYSNFVKFLLAHGLSLTTAKATVQQLMHEKSKGERWKRASSSTSSRLMYLLTSIEKSIPYSPRFS